MEIKLTLNGREVTDSIQADTLLIAGTSLAVYPAAGLIRYFEGDCLALVNLSPTPMDQKADLVIRGKIGEVLSRIQ